MSFSSSDISLASIGADAGIPNLNTADIPADVRNGNQTAKEAYVEGLAFEQVLVGEMTQQLASSLSGDTGIGGSSSYSYGSGSSYGSSSGSDGSTTTSYGGSGASAFSSMIPQALTDSIMDSGGLGIASEVAASIDPSINQPTETT